MISFCGGPVTGSGLRKGEKLSLKIWTTTWRRKKE
jgi:hypothetical protein